MVVKHKWNYIPENWIILGHPPDGTTIDLHIALEPHHKNALVDALHEVSRRPMHPKHVLFTTLLEDYSRVSSFQIWRIPLTGGGWHAVRFKPGACVPVASGPCRGHPHGHGVAMQIAAAVSHERRRERQRAGG
jgi:hypothetical protein